MSLPKVLICDDDQLFHLAVKTALKQTHDVRSAYNGDEALAIVRNHPIDAVLLDIQMRTPDEGLSLIPRLREADPDLAIVMSSGLVDFATVREAMRQGAKDYVPKGFSPDELAITLDRVLQRRALEARNARQNAEAVRAQSRHPLIGESAPMRKLKDQIAKLQATQAPVLILGETGTGKEAVARALRGSLPDGTLAPFVTLDGGALVSTLAESQLFGFEKGAFTGAEKTTRGLFEEAHGGTLFIDEAGEIPLPLQAKFLRILQEKEVVRIGSARPIPVEFRVVAATHSDLEKRVREGTFREDLYQRLNVVPLHVPPLRERRDDVPLLVRHFAEAQDRLEPKAFAPEALEALARYRWPGNVRELRNLVESLHVLAVGPVIELADLPDRIRDSAQADREEPGFYGRVAQFEAEILKAAYAQSQGNVSRLAQELRMDRSHLYTKLKNYGIHGAAGSGGDGAGGTRRN